MKVTSREEVFEKVKRSILAVLFDVPVERVRSDVSLRDLGANSLDRAEIVTMSMRDLELRFPVRELSKVSNIGELVEALYQKSVA